MKPSRRTQPYRRGDRAPGAALRAMLLGKPFFLANPADYQRQLRRLMRKR